MPNRLFLTVPASVPSGWPDRRVDLAVCCVLVAAIAAVYAPVRNYAFINFDDPIYVTENPHVLSGLTPAGVMWAFTNFHGSNWIPFTWLSLMLDATLYGTWAGGFHITNVILHALAAVLLYLALVRMTGARGPAAAVAALFALHPLQVESVAWVTERKDVLSAVGWMATLYAYARYAERPCGVRYAAVAAAYACGLLAKPMLVTLPVVLLLLDVWPLGRLSGATTGGRGATTGGRPYGEKLPLFAAAAAVSVATVAAQHASGAVMPLAGVPVGARIANAIVSAASYLSKLAWPTRLAPFYPYDLALPAWQVFGAAVLLVVLTAGAVVARRVAPALAVGWAWFGVTLLPVIGLVQVGEQAMADRYTYIPMVGIGIAVAFGGAALRITPPPGRPLAAVVASAILVAFAVATTRQLAHWRDSITLFTHANAVTRDNYKARFLLAGALVRAGRLEEALPLYREALALRPGLAQVRNNYANALVRLGRWREALPEYERALRDDPELAEAHNGYGYALDLAGNAAAARRAFGAALAIRPDYVEARFNLADLLARGGELDAAASHLEAALRARPESHSLHFEYAGILARLGNDAGAIEHYREVLRRVPDDPLAHYRLGEVLQRVGRVAEARDHYGAAARLAPDAPEPRARLAELDGGS